MKTGRIFDIQGFSVHDGPGCRTNVFFAGCPLRCRWCANPESWQTGEQLLFSDKRCRWEQGCSACREVCPKASIQFAPNGKPVINRKLCQSCDSFECTGLCVHKALRRCSKMYRPDEIMRILERDSDHWGSDGGVTFSGGEPLLQHEFLYEIIRLCKKKYIHTAIETSGYASEAIFMKIMSAVDFAFMDIKHMDEEAHKAGTGVSNKRILSNLRKLKQSGQHGRIIIRQPVIAGYNDSLENAQRLSDFLNEIGQYELNLLRFHRMGQSKWEQLGMSYPYATGGDVTDKHLKKLQDFYLDHSIACYIGNEILY